jgi:hypothetical protein
LKPGLTKLHQSVTENNEVNIYHTVDESTIMPMKWLPGLSTGNILLSSLFACSSLSEHNYLSTWINFED